MLDWFKNHKAAPMIIGSGIAVVLYLFPEAKPVACGAGFALPAILQ